MPKFAKGQAPGPGRPRGSRNRETFWFDQLGAEGTERLIRVVKDHAEKGDMRAASLVLSRTWPHRRGRAMRLDLPDVETAGGLVQAQAAVIAAMARGELTPDEAASVASVLEAQRRAIETHDHERRLLALEEKKKGEDEGESWESLFPPSESPETDPPARDAAESGR